MIVCPNCNHQNPDGATQCEACYTPLPAMSACPNCGTSVQTDASFCGQCGFDLRANAAAPGEAQATASEQGLPPTAVSEAPPVPPTVAMPPLEQPEPLLEPEPLVSSQGPATTPPDPVAAISEVEVPPAPPQPAATPPTPAPMPVPVAAGGGQTQLQLVTAKLLHVQTNTTLELPQHLSVIHIGKPNERVPPDIDVSGFPHSEVVSRVHSDIRVEGDSYFIEDVGSANGTYVNNLPLAPGNRHRLRPGDRIALGKGDLVTFLFQLS
jgi:ribosomal protein L40E